MRQKHAEWHNAHAEYPNSHVLLHLQFYWQEQVRTADNRTAGNRLPEPHGNADCSKIYRNEQANHR